MQIPHQGKLLRIFIGEADQFEGRPLYQAIVELARKEHMAGATAVKGFMGFGRKSHMHTTKLLRLSQDLPIIIEIVDAPEKVQSFIGKLDGMIAEGLVTLEDSEVLIYRA